MSPPKRIYLDNAATSWPKPEVVYQAVDHYLRDIGAPNGRSGYREALESNRIIERARQLVAQLIGTNETKQVIFTASGTDSLNLAILGIVRPGDHVVTTVCEHNSVLRPLRALREKQMFQSAMCHAMVKESSRQMIFGQALRPETRLVAVVHGSNVSGAIQPVEEIGQIVRQHEAMFLVDAAQTLGHVPIDVERLEIDLLASPGHKGLLGPLGTGVLYIRPDLERQLEPLRYGGTGTQSDEDLQPDELPDKYEPGNHNLPGLAGLASAAEFLLARTVETVLEHHQQLTSRLIEGLQEFDSLTIHGPKSPSNRTSVISVSHDSYDPQELAALLEASHGIQSRAGWHCRGRCE